MSDPVVMYCVGATKAGTTWLHRYLQNHPDSHLRSIKEVHYFDTFGQDDKQRRTLRMQSKRDHFVSLRDLAVEEGRNAASFDRRIRDLDELIDVIGGERINDDAYLKYLQRGGRGKQLIGDMTPSYSLLDTETVARMARVQPDCRFIYLLRDPVERLWSHIRMEAKRLSKPDEAYGKRAINILNKTLKETPSIGVAERCDYRSAIKNLRLALPAKNLMIEFSETMFKGDGLRRICEFLGLSFQPGDVTRKIHAGADYQMRKWQKAASARFLREQYEWVADNVGPLPQLWQDNLAKAGT